SNDRQTQINVNGVAWAFHENNEFFNSGGTTSWQVRSGETMTVNDNSAEAYFSLSFYGEDFNVDWLELIPQ
ncbi:MAG: hypothetical protein OCD76_17780, partial [Reichenbachiella sp.]